MSARTRRECALRYPPRSVGRERSDPSQEDTMSKIRTRMWAGSIEDYATANALLSNLIGMGCADID